MHTLPLANKAINRTRHALLSEKVESDVIAVFAVVPK